MSFPYSFEQFGMALPYQIQQMYTYYKLSNGNLRTLVRNLIRDRAVVVADIKYFNALTDKAVALLWTFPPNGIYELIQRYVNVPRGLSKTEYIKRLVDTGAIEVIKQAIRSGTFIPQQQTKIGAPQPSQYQQQMAGAYGSLPSSPTAAPSPGRKNIPEAPTLTTGGLPSPSIAAAPPSPEPQPEPTLTAVDLNVTTISVEDQLTTEALPSYTITYEQLKDVIQDPDFISNYITALENLYRDKYVFYKQIQEQLTRETEDIKKEFDKMKRLDPSIKMNEMYPQYRTYLLMATELENINLIIRAQLERGFGAQTVKNGLSKALTDSKYGLGSIVGRENIKNTIAIILYSFSKNYRTFAEMFNNFAFYGPAGVGKTRTANIVGYVFHQAYLLLKENIQIVTRADLVGQHIGSTAPRTRSILLRSLESVLLIDEAYQLPPPPDSTRDFGQEAITEIVNFLDKYIGKNIVIVAGYEKAMRERFMQANEGLPRRFPNVIVLEPYTNQELTLILIKNIRERSNILIDDQTASYMYSLISLIQNETPSAFKNQAGDMLNLSSSLLRAIEGAFGKEWINGNLENNIPLILTGFNDFLRNKDIQLALK